MFSTVKSWDNREQRRKAGRLAFTDGKSWTRRIRWLADGDATVKLKLEDGDQYREVIALSVQLADRIWQRFKDGQPINDCVSILAVDAPAALQSKRAGEGS